MQLSTGEAASARRHVGHTRDCRLHVQCITGTVRRGSPYERNRLQQKWGHVALLPFSRLRTSFAYQRKQGGQAGRRVSAGSFLPCYCDTLTLSIIYTVYSINRISVRGSTAGQRSADQLPGEASSNCHGSGLNYVAYAFVFFCTINICRLYKSAPSPQPKPLCNLVFPI